MNDINFFDFLNIEDNQLDQHAQQPAQPAQQNDQPQSNTIIQQITESVQPAQQFVQQQTVQPQAVQSNQPDQPSQPASTQPTKPAQLNSIRSSSVTASSRKEAQERVKQERMQLVQTLIDQFPLDLFQPTQYGLNYQYEETDTDIRIVHVKTGKYKLVSKEYRWFSPRLLEQIGLNVEIGQKIGNDQVFFVATAPNQNLIVTGIDAITPRHKTQIVIIKNGQIQELIESNHNIVNIAELLKRIANYLSNES